MYVLKKALIHFSYILAEKLFRTIYLLINSSNRVNSLTDYLKLVKNYNNYLHTYLSQTPEIGQGLGRFLSCGARKQEQT